MAKIKDPHASTVRAVQSYLEANLARKLSVAEIARTTPVSESLLHRVFRRITGTTIMEYLTRCRIEKAKELLVASTATVSEVSRATGFAASDYFATVFRDKAHCSPSEFRMTKTPKPRGTNTKGSNGSLPCVPRSKP